MVFGSTEVARRDPLNIAGILCLMTKSFGSNAGTLNLLSELS